MSERASGKEEADNPSVNSAAESTERTDDENGEEGQQQNNGDEKEEERGFKERRAGRETGMKAATAKQHTEERRQTQTEAKRERDRERETEGARKSESKHSLFCPQQPRTEKKSCVREKPAGSWSGARLAPR